MKKRDLITLIENMTREALKEELSGKKPHSKKYRRSKFHPDEKEVKKKVVPQPSPFTTSRDAAYELPEPIKALLNSTLKLLAGSEPSAQKVLQGLSIGKQEAMQLAKVVMSIPHFPIQQPRKLMSLLILLAVENQVTAEK